MQHKIEILVLKAIFTITSVNKQGIFILIALDFAREVHRRETNSLDKFNRTLGHIDRMNRVPSHRKIGTIPNFR